MTIYDELLKKYKEKLLNDNNDVTVASLAEENKIDKSVLYRHIKNIFSEEEIMLLKKISRQKAVKKYKDTWIRKYGIDNPAKLQSVKDKQKATFIKNYGVDNPMKNKQIQDKAKESNIKKYGIDNYSKTNEFKKLFNDEDFLKNKKDKEYITKKRNNSFKISQQEDKIYDILLTKFKDVKRQYKSDLYPFKCDFYIPKLDLYIEYQGSWTHGGIPFDINNDKCLEQLNKWLSKPSKYYKLAVQVWVKLDVNKRKIAKKNNLNWIEFFNMNQFMEWFNKQ